MYEFPSENFDRSTRPPCFSHCPVAAGRLLNTRHGVVPAVIAAPMTSSVLLPAGTSWALICSLGCEEFQEETIALPHCTSWALLEYQMVIGPCAFMASV